MSYINGPRINFWGGGSTNVDTANNEQYDDQGRTLVDLSEASVTKEKSDEQIIDYLRTPTETGNDEQDKRPYYVQGGWNYYGDHQVALHQAKVASAGPPGEVSEQTPLKDLPVYLLGSLDPHRKDGPYGGPVMVDLDPTSGTTTQIFAGGLLLGSEDNPSLLVRGNCVAHSRQIGAQRFARDQTSPPYRTPGSAWATASFQFAFRREDIVSFDKSDPTLRAMLEDPHSQGIVVRINLFEFYPGNDTQKVQSDLRENRNTANPSLGRVIGSIGPWYQGELATDPPGRLLASKAFQTEGLAWLDEHNQRLTLDLVGTLQGRSIRKQPHDHTKAPGPNVDYGDLIVYAGHQRLGTIASDPNGYYVYGGLYELDLTKLQDVKAVKQQPLLIVSSKGALHIEESALRITSDDRNIYCDASTEASTLTVQVTHLGQPVREDTVLTLSSGKSGTLPSGGFLELPDPASVRVPAGSSQAQFTVTMNHQKSGFSSLTLSHEWASCSVNFRRYPHHDYSTLINSGKIPWETAYEECLRFYYVLFPAMSKRIPLNDEATIRAVGDEILKRTSPEYRDTTLYMPLTRALSPGKIDLLRAFVQQNS